MAERATDSSVESKAAVRRSVLLATGLVGVMVLGDPALSRSQTVTRVEAASTATVSGTNRRAVQSIFAPIAALGGAGCAAVVTSQGEVVLYSSTGLASLEHQVPITKVTRFRLASLSKQFTATVAVILDRDGLIDLDDPVRRYLPELSTAHDAVSLADLIHHTSGIRNYFTLWSLRGGDIESPKPPAEILSLISRQQRLSFPPGERREYSNSNDFLLAEILERATARSLEQLAEQYVFGPLDMRSTRFARATDVTRGLAQSYSEGDDGSVEARALRSTLRGDGGVVSTVEDLARWSRFLDGALSLDLAASPDGTAWHGPPSCTSCSWLV